MFAFTGLVGRPISLRGPGGSGFRGDLAVGVVEEAEGFAAEGGGAATVVVGENVVAGGCWDHFHRWGLSPRYFWAQGWRGSAGFSRFGVKCECPGPARTAMGFARDGSWAVGVMGSISIVASGVG